MFWKEHKYLIITFAGFVAAFGIFYLFVFRPFNARLEERNGELGAVRYKLEAFYREVAPRGGVVPMDTYFAELTDLKERKKKNVAELEKKLAIRPDEEFSLQKGEKYHGAYFKKILDRKRTELLQESSKRNIELPEDLGFGEEIPPDPKAADLLRTLYIKDRLVRIALDTGIRQITAIEHFDVLRTGPSADCRFINEYPVRLKLQGTLESALKFLYRLRSENQFLVLRGLEIQGANTGPTDAESLLGIVINVAGMTFSDVQEETFRAVEPKKPVKAAVPLGI